MLYISTMRLQRVYRPPHSPSFYHFNIVRWKAQTENPSVLISIELFSFHSGLNSRLNNFFSNTTNHYTLLSEYKEKFLLHRV
jgi:hypothetical protein